MASRGGIGSRHCLRAVAFLLSATLAFAFALERSARAAPPPPVSVRTVEELHEGCPKSPSLAERLTARLERVHEAEDSEPAVRVEVRVERSGNLSHGVLTLDVGSERAEREAVSPSCEEVLAALAVMAAIGLDEGVLPPPAPVASPPPSAPVRGRRESPVPIGPRSPPSRRRDDGPPDFSLGTGLETSANRSLVVMPTLFGALRFRRALAPTLWLGVGRSFSERFATRQGSASVRWSEVLFGACAAIVRVSSLGVGPCVNAEIGRLDAVVDPPLPFRSQSRWWVTAGASARLSWQVHAAFSFEVNGGVRLPIARDQLVFEPATVVYEAPAVVPVAGAAFLARLP